MKRITTILLFSIITCTQPLQAQAVVCSAHFDNETCTDIIPAEAEVIAASISKSEINGCFWMCSLSALNLWSSSSNLNIDMENLSTLNASGTEITIWAKLPSTINLDSCTTVIIYHEEGVIINIDTTCNFVTLNPCTSVAFDYNTAPSGGCFDSVGDQPGHSYLLYPNPAENDLTISCGNLFNEEVELLIIDVQGKIFYTEHMFTDIQGNIPVHLPDLQSGIYIVSVRDRMHDLLVIK